MDDLRTQLERIHAECFGWALCCCGRNRMRAEDVLQEVYVKVLEGKARHRGEGSFKTWLFGVIRLTARDNARRAWFRQLRLLKFAAPSCTSQSPPHETDFDDGQIQTLLAVLQQLPARQREALHLAFYQNLSLAEAAGVMGVSLGTARTHYERGKASLRTQLAAIFQEDRHEPSTGRTAPASALP